MNEQGDLFNGNGQKRRDDGIKRVSLNNKEWMALAILLLHHLPHGWKGLPEDWRFPIIKAIGPPSNPHAWGALTRTVILRGLIRPTGTRLHMKARKSNARMTDQYERP